MAQFSYSTESPAKVKADVVVLPVFKGPDPGPGVKETGLDRAYAAAKLTGETGENLLVPKRSGDRFGAGAVLLVGAGERKEFTVPALRKALGRVAPSLARFGSVATAFSLTFPGGPEAVQAAVEAYTINAARAAGLGQECGSLEPGKRADLIVLDRNPLEVPPEELLRVNVLRTLVAGQEVWP